MTTIPAVTESRREPSLPHQSVLVASDLDRTLIYSANSMKLAGPDHEAPSLVVSEIYEGAPLSFMTRIAETLLLEIMESATFVPVTTRTVQQFLRVRLPGPGTGYAVTTNGAVLLHNGVPDKDWSNHIRKGVDANCAPNAEVLDYLTGRSTVPAILRVRTADDVFVYSIVNREELSDQYLAELSGWCLERGWSTSLQGRKLYCVPLPVTKESAVAEIRRRVPVDVLVAAGDSKLDAGLLELADHAIRPSHGELEHVGHTSQNLHVTSQSGILAGQEILRFALDHVRAAAVITSPRDRRRLQPSMARPL